MYSLITRLESRDLSHEILTRQSMHVKVARRQRKIDNENCLKVFQIIDFKMIFEKTLEIVRVKLHENVLKINHRDDESKIICKEY